MYHAYNQYEKKIKPSKIKFQCDLFLNIVIHPHIKAPVCSSTKELAETMNS